MSNLQTAGPPASKEKKASLDASVRDGMWHAIMLGAGETYLSAYAIFLKATSFQVGILATLPPLIGSLSQTLGVGAMERLSGRRRLIVTGGLIQALSWLPVVMIPYALDSGPQSVNFLISIVIIYYIAAHFVTPIWNSLMGDLVPVETRGLFFGARNRIAGMATFLSLSIAGLCLHVFKNQGLNREGFAAIFLIAMTAKLISVFWLSRYQDPPFHVNDSHRFSFWDFVSRSPNSNFAKFVFFVSAMNFSAYVAGPFFALYMLNDIKMSYFEYTFVISIVMLAQFATMRYWGALTDQFGNRKILSFCGIGVAIVPFLWLISANTVFIALIQAMAGSMWAGFNLAAANFMFDAVSPPKRARCVAYQSIINGFFVLSGSLLGSFLITGIPADFPMSGGLSTPSSPYLRIFFISGLLRGMTLLFMLRLFKEVRPVESIRHRDLIFRISHIKPFSGTNFSVITGIFRKTGEDEPPERSAGNSAEDDKT